MRIAVSIERDAAWLFPFSRYVLRDILACMLEKAGYSETALEMSVVGDAAMEELNRSAMDCPGPTNILSFPAPPASAGVFAPMAPGCMVLSVDTLARECLLYGQEQEAHALRLIAHGLAHVLGYDHGAAMDSLARRLERAAGETL